MTNQTPASATPTSLRFAEFDHAVRQLVNSSTVLQDAMAAMVAANSELTAGNRFSDVAGAAYTVNAMAALKKGEAVMGVVAEAAKLLSQIRDDLQTKDAGIGMVTNIHVLVAAGNPMPGQGQASTTTDLSFGVSYDQAALHGQAATAAQAGVPFTLP